jgi:hypothetical protein
MEPETGSRPGCPSGRRIPRSRNPRREASRNLQAAFEADPDLAAIRPTAILTHAPVAEDAPEPCGAVVPTFEIYDVLTRRTQVFTHPLEIFGFNPQPEPPGATGVGSN